MIGRDMPRKAVKLPAGVRFLLLRPRTRLLGTVAATGLIGGVVGAAYLTILKVLTYALGPGRWTPVSHVLVMVAVGLTITALSRLLGRPSGVELLVDNIHVSGGVDSLRQLRSLLPSSLLCIGAGGALGPEAPLVTTTGSLGSWLGTKARLGTRDRRIVSIAGMAAGFTVLFGAPLGSAVFALEILHRKGLEYYEALLPSAIGSLCGYFVYVVVTGLGLEPMFPFPAHTTVGLADLGWSVVAGVAGAGIAASFTYLCVGLRKAIAFVPGALRPALGGLLLGGLAFISPYALTNGEVHIGELNGAANIAATTLLLAAAVKLVSSAVTVVSGWKGGFIIPLFFIGYCLARATSGFLPGSDEWIFAAALMAAANVGVTKTPIGSTLVVTEMAGLELIPSTLIASLVSMLLTSGVGMISSQRQRFDPDESGNEYAGPADLPLHSGATR